MIDIPMVSRDSHSRRVGFPFVAAAVALALFILAGSLRIVAIAATSPWNPPLEPELTSDQFLSVLGVAHPAEQINLALRPFGKDQTLLFVAPASEAFSTQVYFTMLYLAYPRPVGAVMCAAPGKGIASTIREELAANKIAGLVFFEANPGSRAIGSARVGQKLSIIPYKGSEPWQSFCP